MSSYSLESIPVIRLTAPTNDRLADVIGWVVKEDHNLERIEARLPNSNEAFLTLDTYSVGVLVSLFLDHGLSVNSVPLLKVADPNNTDVADLTICRHLRRILGLFAENRGVTIELGTKAIKAIKYRVSGSPLIVFVEVPSWSPDQLVFTTTLLDYQYSALLRRIRGLNGRTLSSLEKHRS